MVWVMGANLPSAGARTGFEVAWPRRPGVSSPGDTEFRYAPATVEPTFFIDREAGRLELNTLEARDAAPAHTEDRS
jgi:hypothetical protein